MEFVGYGGLISVFREEVFAMLGIYQGDIAGFLLWEYSQIKWQILRLQHI